MVNKDDLPLEGLEEICPFYGASESLLTSKHPRYGENKNRIGDMVHCGAAWIKRLPRGNFTYQGNKERILRYKTRHQQIHGHI